ncbi:hypothetical protein M8C21_028088, partial [Ambrosia artemisiifolia]
MALVYPDVVLISSDDEDDGQTNFMTSVANPEIVLISSDDEDGERNLEEGVASEQEAEYIDLDDDESDKEEEDNNIVVEKLNMEISVDNCDRSGGNNLHALSLPECKEYLRKHGIRVSGTKEECIQRIEEHNRPKEEKAKFLFPESSFSINCTGDARERDVVFLRGKHVDKRTVAGRIVKVRQCGSRDKHKFLIKVLWTLPSMNNSRRLPWLVRSHNLYKFGTFRQPWKDETIRSKMFEEKHGPATRKRKLKKKDIALNKNEGKKRQKVSHNGPSPSKQPTQTAKQKSSKGKDARATRVKETKKGSKRKS